MGDGYFEYEVAAMVKLTVIADTPTEAQERAEIDLGEVCSDINIIGVK